MLDRETVRGIVAAGHAVPAGRSVEELTPPLLAALGSPDPVVREPAPEIVDVWIERGLYAPAAMRAMAARMADNLAAGLGERDTDSVFLRAFSLLVLTSIVSRDNTHPFYDAGDMRDILDRVLHYAAAERDLRGYIPGKGWAHAVAHTADILWALASNRHLEAADLGRVLDAIAVLVAPPVAHIYLHNEDERLAHAALGVLHRDLAPPPAVAIWLERLVHPDGRDLGFAALLSQPDVAMRHNTIAFLRGLYFQLAGLAYDPDTLPPGLPGYISDQIRQAPRHANDALPRIAAALRAIGVF